MVNLNKNINLMIQEVEVYRISPEEGKYYMYAEYTRREGKWPTETYFTTNELKYVGLFKRHITHEYRDNAKHIDIFDNYGKEEIVNYSYEGKTSFIKVNPKINSKLKSELIKKYNNKLIPKLSDLVKNHLSTEEIKMVREFNIF